jgi:hypothetical protein
MNEEAAFDKTGARTLKLTIKRVSSDRVMAVEL